MNDFLMNFVLFPVRSENKLKIIELNKIIDMKHQKLNEQMIRYFAGVKPRYHNPTFLSSNVSASMGASLYRSQSMNSFLPPIDSHKEIQQKRSETPKPTQQKSKTKPLSPKQPIFVREQKTFSNFTKNATKSLANINRSVNDKLVYEKQSNKYNIITIQPKQYLDSIRIFPKFRLEHQDEQYLKRQMAVKQISTRYNSLHRKTHDASPLTTKFYPNSQLQGRIQTPASIIKGRLPKNFEELKGRQ